MTERRPFGDLLAYPLRSGVTIAASSRGAGIKMLNMGELFRYPRIPAVEMARVNVNVVDPEKVLLQPGDLMFARRSLTLEGAGKCSIVKEIDEATTWEGSIIRARVDKRVAHAPYYFYFFRSPIGRRTVETIVEQVAAAGIRLSELRNLCVPVPGLHEQRAIAEVLGALDDKIAVNDELATKSAMLAAATFEQSVCTSSTEQSIFEITKLVSRGITPAYADSCDAVMVLNQKCIRNQVVLLAPARRTLRVRARREKVLLPNDVLINSTGQGTLGRVARWTHDHEATVDSHISIVRFDEGVVDPICGGYGVLRLQPLIEQMGEGSTGQTELSRVELTKVRVRLPDRDIQLELGRRLEALSKLQEAQTNQSQVLAAIRDALLPQLMSGKVRVKDAEKSLEEVL